MSITTSAQQILGNGRTDWHEGVPEKYWDMIDRYRDELILHAASILNNREDAEDVAQQTFCDAFRDCEKLPRTGSVGAWLREINRCNALNYLRDKGRAAKRADRKREENPDRTFTTGGFSIIELRELMVQAIKELPENLQKVVELRFWENLSFKEIAARLRLPLGTVQSRLFDASNRMYQKLYGHFEPEGAPSPSRRPSRRAVGANLTAGNSTEPK